MRVLITGPHGFERTVMFALDEDAAVIAERVRQTLEGLGSRLSIWKASIRLEARVWSRPETP